MCKNERGNKSGEFSFPFDPAETDCYLEIALVERDKNGNFYLTGEKYTDLLNDSENGRQLHPGKNKINIHAEFGVLEDEPFAYHYKLVNKRTGEVRQYGLDAGTLIDERQDINNIKDEAIYNLYVPTSNVSKGGSMYLTVPDTLDPKWVYDADNDIIQNENFEELKKHIRLFSTKIGGTLAGMEKRLEDGSLDPYDRIVSLPMFTDDSQTHHAYWNKNCMQMALSLGNINNYTALTKKLFAKGKTLVSDGAFVNEGLEGIHFNHAIRWQEQSPFFNWFRINSNDQILLGVYSQNTNFLKHRLVNPPFFYKQNNKGEYIRFENEAYEKYKPTYFEIYDKELVDENKLDPQEPIKAYDKTFYDNPLSKSTHNDTVIPYRIPIDPKEYDINIQRLNEYNSDKSIKIRLYDGVGTKFIAQFSNLLPENKIEGNIDTWNSNFDIAKIHYFLSNNDMDNILSLKPGLEQKEHVKQLEMVANEAKDYVITSAQYWTKKTNDILNLHVAQNLKHIDEENSKEAYKTVIKKTNAGIFPERLKNNFSEDVVENIINGTYKLKPKNTKDFKEQVAQYMMNVPLDSIELGDDVSAVFATPYISKRSCKEDYIGTATKYSASNGEFIEFDRYTLNKTGNPHIQPKYAKVYAKTNNLFVPTAKNPNAALTEFAVDIINRLNNDKERPANQKIHINGVNTEYGNYVVPILAEEILKYAVIKSLCDAPRFQTNDNGEISYDYNRLKKISLASLGIKAINPEDEAEQLIKRLKTGLNNISESDKEALADALKKKIKGTNATSFRLAEAIVDRTQSGLDWRIDAAKDVADIDSLRNNQETDFDTVFGQVTDFWQKFSQNVLKENPNSYMVAELTDMNDLYDKYGQDSQRYPSKTNLIGKFLTDSELTSIANYDYYFSTLPEMFAKNFNNGQNSTNGNNYLEELLHNKLTNPETGFIRSAQQSALALSYTFINNHDNTRALHALAVDPEFFHGIQNNWTGADNRAEAIKLLTGNYDTEPHNIENFNFDRISSKDLAMVKTLRDAFYAELDEMCDTQNLSKDKNTYLKEALKAALTEIANGQYQGVSFEKDSFGTKPIDLAIDFTLSNAKNLGFEISDKDMNILSENVFARILRPAYQKYAAMMEYLVALPGNPTIYSGDELASTGYEYETKNVTLQNRSYLHNEWVDKHSPEKRKFVIENNNNIRKIMHQRKRTELQALNDGAIFPLKMQVGISQTGKNVQIPAILRENTAGYMTLSLFNTSDLDKAHDSQKELIPNTVSIREISLAQEVHTIEHGQVYNVGLPAGLPEKTIFLDAAKNNNDFSDIYVVEKNSENNYVIKHRIKEADGRYKEAPIKLENNTMILYHVPKQNKNDISFKGKKYLYNPQYKISNITPTSLYATKTETCLGEKLSLVSR